jgi:hypothetical protein
MEEYRTMLPWISEHVSIVPVFVRSIIPESPAFIAYAGLLLLILFTVAGVIAIRSRPRGIAWILLSIFIVARLENAVLHAIESLVLMQYTPGLLTAVFLVLPLSVYLVRRFLRLDLIRGSRVPAIIVAALIAQSVGIGMILLFGG